MTRAAQTARLLAVANDDARPFFQPSLRQLASAAVEAADALQAITAKPREAHTDEEYLRADEAAFEARKALLDHLLIHHAIDRDLAAKIGGVL